MKRLDLIFFEFFSNIEMLALLLENIQDKTYFWFFGYVNVWN